MLAEELQRQDHPVTDRTAAALLKASGYRKQRAVLCIILVALLLSWSWREGSSTNSDKKITQISMKRIATMKQNTTTPATPATPGRAATDHSPLPRLLSIGLTSIGLTAQVALAQSPGQVVAWGDNTYGETNVPAAAQSGVVAMAAGLGSMVALKNDGSVVAWGDNSYGESNVPSAAQRGMVAIAAG
jgi:Regulator of Chromosome Condensation (RCC1) repeat protein